MKNKIKISLIVSLIISLSSINTNEIESANNISYADNFLESNLDSSLSEQALDNNQTTSDDSKLEEQMNTYNLSMEELEGIARLCQQEQYTLEGSAAEASLMANRYELYGQNYSSLYSYVKNSGWFANAAYYMDKTDELQKEALEVVRQVLVEGKRTLPRYIDSHDSLSDVSFINTGDANCQIDYEKDETKIYNIYGSNYYFYDFPGTSDPFGYTSIENKNNLGEKHYEFEKILKR